MLSYSKHVSFSLSSFLYYECKNISFIIIRVIFCNTSYVVATRAAPALFRRSFRHVSGNILLSTMRVCRLVRFDHSLTLSAPFLCDCLRRYSINLSSFTPSNRPLPAQIRYEALTTKLENPDKRRQL